MSTHWQLERLTQRLAARPGATARGSVACHGLSGYRQLSLYSHSAFQPSTSMTYWPGPSDHDVLRAAAVVIHRPEASPHGFNVGVYRVAAIRQRLPRATA